jgi:hypothetical protein
VGVVAYGVFTFACAMILFLAIKAVMGLRVSEDEEIEGLDYGEHGMHCYDFAPSGGGAFDLKSHGGRPSTLPTTHSLAASEQG